MAPRDKVKKHPKLSKEEKETAEKQLAEIRNFQEMWFNYLKMFKAAFNGAPITRESEEQFLRMKCQLARKHEYLVYWLGKDYVHMEPITKILRDTMDLRHMADYKRDFYVKIETAWHRVALNLARTIGHYKVLLDDSLRT